MPKAPSPPPDVVPVKRPTLFVGSVVLLFSGFAAGYLIATLIGGQTSKPAAPSAQSPADPNGNYAQIIRDLKNHLSHAPDDLQALIQLGNALYDTGNHVEAVQYYARALQIDPKNPDVRVDMGTAYRNLKDSRRAAEEFKKAISYAPRHPNAHYNLGIVLRYDLNDTQGAVQAWTRYLELAPNAPNAAQVRAGLEEMKRGIPPIRE